MKSSFALRLHFSFMAAPLLCLTSCIWPSFGRVPVAVSPDGRYIAFASGSALTVGIPPEPGKLLRKEFRLSWYDRAHHTLLGRVELPWAGTVAFSPDSSKLAILSERLSVFDVRGKQPPLITPLDELALSFAWRTASTLVYVSCPVASPHEGPKDRSFFEQDVRQAPEERRLLYKVAGLSPPIGSAKLPAERWSPKGRYAFFGRGVEEPRLEILDVEGPTVHDLGFSRAVKWHVAWKSDESQVFCATYSDFHHKADRALIVNLPSGEILDRTQQFTTDRMTILGASFKDQWTVDDRYLVMNSTQGGCLVDPIAWKTNKFGELVKKQLEDDGELNEREKSWAPGLQPFPVPGWTLVQVANSYWLANYDTKRIHRAFGIWKPYVFRTGAGLVCHPETACRDLPKDVLDAVK